MIVEGDCGVRSPVLRVLRLTDRAVLPRYETAGAAGMDLVAAPEAAVTIGPGERSLIPTGIAVALPPGHEGQVRPRSGLAVHHGVTLVNAPGTIDEDYRGEVKVAMINLGAEPFEITPGMRVAQLIIAPVTRLAIEETAELDSTARGAGGFGHTGQ